MEIIQYPQISQPVRWRRIKTRQ